MKHWQKNKSIHYWLQHSILPIAFLLLFLAVPKSWLIETSAAIISHTIKVELSKQSKKAEAQKTEAEKQIEPPKPLVDTDQPKPSEAPPKPAVEKPPIPKETTQSQRPQISSSKLSAQPKSPVIDASDVQIMMSKTVDSTIDDVAFTARSNNNKFITKQYVAQNSYADLPYQDESVDAPRLQMDFYSGGYMGNVERFFDKITYEKTFTTKYGTKIKCAVVGVLAMCGWK